MSSLSRISLIVLAAWCEDLNLFHLYNRFYYVYLAEIFKKLKDKLLSFK